MNKSESNELGSVLAEAMKPTVDFRIEAYENLLKCCGHWQDGSQTKVTITQDDATFEYLVKVGNKLYHSKSLGSALMLAAEDIQE